MDQPTRNDNDRAAHRRAQEQLAAGSDLRARKVRRLRAAIRAGRYENLLKLTVAADRLLDALDESPGLRQRDAGTL